MRAMSALSSKTIRPADFDREMRRLSAQPANPGWLLERDGHKLWVELASEDIEFMFTADDLDRAQELLNGQPVVSRVALIFDDGEERFELRMAKAAARALSDVWPVVLDDHAGTMQRL